MNWIITIVVGGLIGWLASLIMKTDAQMGLIANVLVGIVGSILGFWVAGLLGMTGESAIVGYAIAVVGAILLILILKVLGIFK